jgi:putative ABC transport system permease protein
MLRFVAADLRRHWIGVLAIALIIALATALGIAVTLQERALRLGSARAAEAFDLVVGAAGSETQLILSSVFLQAAPLPLMPGTVLAALIADPRVDWAAPVGFGDFAGNVPIVGTTEPLVDGLGGLAEGRSFERLGEAVAGSAAPFALGAKFTPLHGRVEEGGHAHGDIAYTVVGRMAPTGTPWDKAVLVPIEAVWAVHAHGGAEARGPLAALHEDHDHDAGPDLARPIDPAALSRPGAPGLPAILVKPKTIADAYKLRTGQRTDTTLAVFPAEVLTKLYGTLGDARFILSAVAAGAQALVAAAILLVVTIHVLQRRRQIGALRAFGAPRGVVFAIVWLESFVIVGIGVIAGFGLGYLAVRLGSAMLAREAGFALPVELRAGDLAAVAVLLAVTAAASLVPALLAYRQSAASALRA